MSNTGGDVIKSFLVGLGFDVDESSLAAFNKGIQSAALRVTALYGAINAFAGSMVFAFAKISEGFEEMGYQYHIIAPAINKAIVLRNELLKAYSAAGVNIRKVIVDSVNLNMSLAKTKFAMEAIYKSVGSKFFGLLQKQSDAFRRRLYENMPYIISVLTKLVNTVFKAFDGVVQLGQRVWEILSRVYDFFVALDHATNGWSTIVIGLIAAWKLLNLSFLASPLGIILSLGAAILLLYDDFKTFREGGRSLIDWGSDFTKMTVGLIAAIGAVATAFYAWKTITTVVTAVTTAIKAFNAATTVAETLAAIAASPFLAIAAAISAVIVGLTLADQKWQIFGGHLAGFFSGIGGKILDFVAGAPDLLKNIAGTGTPGTPPAPALGTGPNNNSTNVHANMQTQVNVTGSPNADATGKAVAGQQNAINGTMVRNLKGAVR